MENQQFICNFNLNKLQQYEKLYINTNIIISEKKLKGIFLSSNVHKKGKFIKVIGKLAILRKNNYI